MFAINQSTCTMGKISNNLEKHGDEDVPAWTIPIAGILIDLAMFEELLHDGRASEAFFVRNPETDILEPRPWLSYCSPIELTEAYDGMATSIKFGDQVLEFDRSRLKDLVIGRFYPGMAQVDCKLQLYPGLDHANLVLQEAQNMPILLTVLDAKVAKSKKLRQQELPLSQAGEAQASEDDLQHNSGADDELYPDVLRWVLESRITTLGGVQMQFRIDQFRATAILLAMEDAGVVGPVREDNSREIYDGETHAAERPGDDDDAEDDETEETPPPPDPDVGPSDDDGADAIDPPGSEPTPNAAGVWPMAAPGSDELPTSRTGRAITAHAKRAARKRARNGDARAH